MVERVRQHVRDGHGERDPHDGGHHLAPVPELQGRAHPRQAPAGDREGVARQAGGQHPPPDRGSGGDAEHEDEERVDLAVEAAPERGDRSGAPGHPSVDGIQGEGRHGQGEHRRASRGRPSSSSTVRAATAQAIRARPSVTRSAGPSACCPACARPRVTRVREHGGATQGDGPRRFAQTDRRRQQGEQGHEPQQPDGQANDVARQRHPDGSWLARPRS